MATQTGTLWEMKRVLISSPLSCSMYTSIVLSQSELSCLQTHIDKRISIASMMRGSWYPLLVFVCVCVCLCLYNFCCGRKKSQNFAS